MQVIRRYGNERIEFLLDIFHWVEDCVKHALAINPNAFDPEQTWEHPDLLRETLPYALAVRDAEIVVQTHGFSLQEVLEAQQKYAVLEKI